MSRCDPLFLERLSLARFEKKTIRLWAFAGLLLLFTYVFIANAWIVDDAYITFRTVDNFIHGYGFTWNVTERVLINAHPLWMFLITPFYLITSEAFITVLALSFLICIATLLIAYCALKRTEGGEPWKPLLLVGALLVSKAFIDFTSSGLENCLSYFFAALFYSFFLFQPQPAREFTYRRVWMLFFITALSFCTRQDAPLLYLPALIYLVFQQIPRLRWRLVSLILTASAPAILWIGFSLFYFGFPFSNTAYAKVFCTGFPLSWKVERGFEYLANSLAWDTASHVMAAGAVVLSLTARSKRSLLALAGVLFYYLFIIFSAASATHMSGRFFAVPFFIAILVFVKNLRHARVAMAVAFVLLLYLVIHPLSPVKMGTSLYSPREQCQSYIDTNVFAHGEGAALMNWRPGKFLPDHDWYYYGVEFKKTPQNVHIGGAFGGEAIGYFGYAAGPEKHIIDCVALTDTLLARLPGIRPPRIDQWKSGHFHRVMPDGYLESIMTGQNLITDPDLNRYYEMVRIITQGPLFTWERFSAIWGMNWGLYDALIKR